MQTVDQVWARFSRRESTLNLLTQQEVLPYSFLSLYFPILFSSFNLHTDSLEFMLFWIDWFGIFICFFLVCFNHLKSNRVNFANELSLAFILNLVFAYTFVGNSLSDLKTLILNILLLPVQNFLAFWLPRHSTESYLICCLPDSS